MGLYLKKRKKVLKNILVGFSLFFVGSFFLLLFLFLLKSFVPPWVTRHPLLPVLVLSAVFVVAFKPIERAVMYCLRRFVFKHKSYAHLTLMNLADELALVLELEELSNLTVNTFGEI